ncbi:MAG: hypothetical protein ABI541_06995 [Betaproteobacteria bacterium]
MIFILSAVEVPGRQAGAVPTFEGVSGILARLGTGAIVGEPDLSLAAKVDGTETLVFDLP